MAKNRASMGMDEIPTCVTMVRGRHFGVRRLAAAVESGSKGKQRLPDFHTPK